MGLDCRAQVGGITSKPDKAALIASDKRTDTDTYRSGTVIGKRCMVGRKEWQTKGAKKQPYKIALRNGGLLAFAGLWETWTPEIGEPVETFAIITTQANKLISEVGERMPAIIPPADYQRWLTAPVTMAKKLLVPYTSGMTITPVSERLNSIKNDDVELLAPL